MTTPSPPDAQTLIVLFGFAVALFALLGITAVVALTDISRAVRRIDRLLQRRDLARQLHASSKGTFPEE